MCSVPIFPIAIEIPIYSFQKIAIAHAMAIAIPNSRCKRTIIPYLHLVVLYRQAADG